MKYAGIPKKVLKMVMGECYGLGEYTLEDELKKYGQDLIAARWEIGHEGEPYIKWFHAWTKDYAMVLIDSIFGDKCILGMNRDIPEELLENGRSKEKSKRTRSRDSKTNKSK